MTEKEQIQNQIQELQEKLKKLEAQEPEMLLLRQGKVDFVDYDRKKYIRIEYTDSFADTYNWYVRRVGEDAIRPVRDVNVYASLEELYQKEVVKQKDEYPYKVDETQKKSVYHITDEHGETNPHKKHLNSVKMEELGFVKNFSQFVKNSDDNWTARPLGETPQEPVKQKDTLYDLLGDFLQSSDHKETVCKIVRDWLDQNTTIVEEDYSTVTLKLKKGAFGDAN